MFYVYTHTIAEVTYTYPYDFDLHLTAGVIHQVDVLFQDGCDHNVSVQIYEANYQIWPSNRGAWLKGNATVVSFREFYELEPGSSILTVRIGLVAGQAAGKDVVIQIGLLPRKIIQPMNFEALLDAAAGLE